MKEKKIAKKLTLNKKTVSTLRNAEMDLILAGGKVALTDQTCPSGIPSKLTITSCQYSCETTNC